MNKSTGNHKWKASASEPCIQVEQQKCPQFGSDIWANLLET